MNFTSQILSFSAAFVVVDNVETQRSCADNMSLVPCSDLVSLNITVLERATLGYNMTLACQSQHKTKVGSYLNNELLPQSPR